MNVVLRFIALLLRHRRITGLAILISVGASLYAARNIELRFQYKDFYEYEGNPRLPLLTRYTQEFGDPGSFVVLLVESGDVFRNDVLQYVDELTRGLEATNEFLQVRSLTNAQIIRAQGEDVAAGPLLGKLPLPPDQLQQARQAAVASSLLARRLVARDSTATAVLAEMRTPGAFSTIPQQQAAVDVAREVLHRRTPPPGVRAQVTGAPVVEVSVTRALIDDQAVLTPVLFGALLLALGLTFRSIHGVLLPLASVLVSMAWTFGISSYLGHPIDLVGSVIPTTLLVYSIVDPIFVYSRYQDKLPFSRTSEQAVLDAMRELVLPCFLTSLATALGFGAFATAQLPTIKYFGIVVAIGVLLAFVTTITVLPLLLVAVAPSHASAGKAWIPGMVDSLMAWLWQSTRARPEVVMGLALSTLILGIGAARGVPINCEVVGSLPKGSVLSGVRLMEEKLTGAGRIAIYLEGEADSMKRPEVLRAIEALDRVAEQQPIVTSSISLADLVADTNQAFFEGDGKERIVPDSESLISQYLTLVDPGDLTDFVSGDYSRSHLRILVADEGSQSVWRLRDVLQREIDARFQNLGVQATITGYGVVAYHDADNVVVEVLWGFVLAFSVIVLLELIVFRSLRIALISIVPNLIPAGACVLVLRTLEIPMRIDTALVWCISVGGLFNTTIHIAARVLQQLREGAAEPDVVVGRALAAAGPPSLYTAAILSLGFAVLGLSRFPGLQYLGLLCMITLLTGFVADATITTSFFKLFFNWNSARPAEPGPALAPSLEAVSRADEEAAS